MQSLRAARFTAAAFVGVVVLAELSPALPHHPAPILHWWFAGLALTGAAAAVAAFAQWHRNGHWVRYLPLLLFLVAVQMLRAADGNGSSGFSPLLILPVVWYALYGNRVSLSLALSGVAVVMCAPQIVIGEPEYPVTLWRAAVLWVLILVIVGLAVRRLVAAIRNKSAALAASEVRFRSAFNAAPTGVTLVGASGAQTGIFLRVNEAMCALLGYREDELVGRSILEVTHPDDRTQAEQLLLAPVEKQHARTVEKRYLHSSGREVLASMGYTRIDEPGGAAYFVAHIQDITPRRAAETEMLAALEQQTDTSERLQRLDRARAHLVSVVTHELTEPLTGIGEAVRGLGCAATQRLTAQQAALVRQIEQHAARLSSITADLVTLARTEEELADQPAELVDIEAVVQGAIESIRPVVRGRDQALQVDIDLSGAQVTGEAGKLDRVLMNLLENAVKFTPPGGAIDTQARVRGDAVVIDVTDTGIGIEGDELGRIFDRFYRARAAAEQSIPGDGLGLAIVKAIAEQHHGSIEVFSEPGAGSTFTLTLPLSGAASG